MINRPLKTHIPDNLKSLKKISVCSYRKYRPDFYAADTLIEICSHVVDGIPPPLYWSWTPEDVAEWVAVELSHPELREAFLKNEIDGMSLIFLEADKLPRISIRRFDLIKARITPSIDVLFYFDMQSKKELRREIRNLCEIDQDEFKRSISLPIRRPLTLYRWYLATHTGPTAYFMTPSKYFRKVNLIQEEDHYYDLLNHWNRIPPYRPWCPHVMIGANRRINPMTGTTLRQNFHPKGHPYLLKELCIYHLPC